MTNCEYENKISDDEIISSLEVIATTRNCDECKIRNCKWGDCDCSKITANAALDLINRQKTEIEQWKEEANKYQNLWCTAVDDIKTAKVEAYKEFADKIKMHKRKMRCFDLCYEFWDFAVSVEDIDIILQEMLGEE